LVLSNITFILHKLYITLARKTKMLYMLKNSCAKKAVVHRHNSYNMTHEPQRLN